MSELVGAVLRTRPWLSRPTRTLVVFEVGLVGIRALDVTVRSRDPLA